MRDAARSGNDPRRDGAAPPETGPAHGRAGHEGHGWRPRCRGPRDRVDIVVTAERSGCRF